MGTGGLGTAWICRGPVESAAAWDISQPLQRSGTVNAVELSFRAARSYPRYRVLPRHNGRGSRVAKQTPCITRTRHLQNAVHIGLLSAAISFWKPEGFQLAACKRALRRSDRLGDGCPCQPSGMGWVDVQLAWGGVAASCVANQSIGCLCASGFTRCSGYSCTDAPSARPSPPSGPGRGWDRPLRLLVAAHLNTPRLEHSSPRRSVSIHPACSTSPTRRSGERLSTA